MQGWNITRTIPDAQREANPGHTVDTLGHSDRLGAHGASGLGPDECLKQVCHIAVPAGGVFHSVVFLRFAAWEQLFSRLFHLN